MSFLPFEPPDGRGIGLEFLRTELSLAATFIRIAHSHHDDSAIHVRNQQNARTAYDAILRFLPRFSLSASEQDEFDTGLRALKLQLLELGEVFA